MDTSLPISGIWRRREARTLAMQASSLSLVWRGVDRSQNRGTRVPTPQTTTHHDRASEFRQTLPVKKRLSKVGLTSRLMLAPCGRS